MEQDFSKDLVLLVTGTGSVTLASLRDNLEDFIFGPPAAPGEEEIMRDVKILLLDGAEGPGIDTLMRWGIPSGMEFKKIQGADDREALENAFAELVGDMTDGKETVFAMLYNPDSKYEQGNSAMTDLEILGEAKNYSWLTTLNLSEGLIDSFEGYESTDDRIKREKLEEEFDRKKRAEEPHPFKPSAEDEERCHLCTNFKADMRHSGPAKKTAAKKAVTPRKKAAPKPVEAEDKPLLDAPEKPLAAPSVTPVVAGLDNLVAKAVEREAAKKLPKHRWETRDGGAGWTEGSCMDCGTDIQTPDDPCVRPPLTLSGNIVMSREPKKTELPKDVAVVTTEEVWQDVAKAVPPTDISVTHFTVAKADIIKLNEGMQKMASGFSEILDAYKSIVEGK